MSNNKNLPRFKDFSQIYGGIWDGWSYFSIIENQSMKTK
jgi:hypothetical protein